MIIIKEIITFIALQNLIFTPCLVDEKNLKSLVADNVDIHVAMFGRAEIETFQSDYRYVSMISSPGIAWVVRDPQAELDKAAAIMKSLATCWPAIIIIIVFSMVAGIVIFVAVRISSFLVCRLLKFMNFLK